MNRAMVSPIKSRSSNCYLVLEPGKSYIFLEGQHFIKPFNDKNPYIKSFDLPLRERKW